MATLFSRRLWWHTLTLSGVDKCLSACSSLFDASRIPRKKTSFSQRGDTKIGTKAILGLAVSPWFFSTARIKSLRASLSLRTKLWLFMEARWYVPVYLLNSWVPRQRVAYLPLSFCHQVSAWEESGSRSKAQIALEIERAGQLMTATELRSARKYWHVSDDEKIKIYPSSYTPHAIGMLWQTMAQCQTWFGAAAYLAYGIQLLPLTPVSEHRDTLSWSKETYHNFAESCNADPECTNNGWSIIQLALLGTVGHQQDSSEIAISLPADVFESAGGNGHSLTNTLWYLSTRPVVDTPLPLSKNETTAAAGAHATYDDSLAKANQVTDCGTPDTCTDYVLDTIAGEYSCRQRMDWLVQQMGRTELEACHQIAGYENIFECGACDPEAKEQNKTKHAAPKCAQCTHEKCQSDLNRCPSFGSTFVCTDGNSMGGCSGTPWNVPSQQCRECCELTYCSKPDPAEERAKNEEHCPRCTRTQCRGSVNQCARRDGLQYLCLKGHSEGGCALLPWAVKDEQCSKCCTVYHGCGV